MYRILREYRTNLHNSALGKEKDREGLTGKVLFQLSHKKTYRSYSGGEEMGGQQRIRNTMH